MHVYQCLKQLDFLGFYDSVLVANLYFAIGLDNVIEHLGDLLRYEGQRPAKHIQKVGEDVRMLLEVELLDVYLVFLNKQSFTTNLITAALLLYTSQ